MTRAPRKQGKKASRRTGCQVERAMRRSAEDMSRLGGFLSKWGRELAVTVCDSNQRESSAQIGPDSRSRLSSALIAHAALPQENHGARRSVGVRIHPCDNVTELERILLILKLDGIFENYTSGRLTKALKSVDDRVQTRGALSFLRF